ncbi:hypothetical protein ACGFNU_14895 [Spirillospora sp. NPDC048911]|uniref:hypothetical protein n=1 Tax=Spirillospora sp. NPDC048911 TaxID=3364527 RepID=UPI003723962B
MTGEQRAEWDGQHRPSGTGEDRNTAGTHYPNGYFKRQHWPSGAGEGRNDFIAPKVKFKDSGLHRSSGR